MFRCIIAGVCYFYRNFRLSFPTPVDFRIGNLLGESGTFYAISKAVGYFIVIIPYFSAVYSLTSESLGRISLVENGIKITGFIIFVTNVNALFLCQIPSASQGVVGRSVDIVCICKYVCTVISHCRCKCRVYRIGIGEMSGWKYVAFQKLCDSVCSIASWISNPEDTVYCIILFQFFNLHCTCRVQKNDHFFKTLVFYIIDQCSLCIGQAQDISCWAVGKFFRI